MNPDKSGAMQEKKVQNGNIKLNIADWGGVHVKPNLEHLKTPKHIGEVQNSNARQEGPRLTIEVETNIKRIDPPSREEAMEEGEETEEEEQKQQQQVDEP
eukprot:1097674-Pyramimonas_sp.AAC.2